MAFIQVETFIDANRLPHLLFYGPPGTGKTSTILACARKLYGDNYKSMILEVGIHLSCKSSDFWKILLDECFRRSRYRCCPRTDQELCEHSKYIQVMYYEAHLFSAFITDACCFSSGFKLIILDEADSMTNQAQAALRRGKSFIDDG